MNSLYLYQTERIAVRGLSRQELQGNYPKWFLDAQVCAHNSHFAYPKSLESIGRYIDSLEGNEAALVWAVFHRAEGVHLGNVSLRIFNRIDNNAEMGFLFGERAYWGQGYAAEAGQIMLRHGFSVLNLNRIYCGCARSNLPMQRLAAKLGFAQEGVRRNNLFLQGRYEDEIEFGLLRSEFSEAS
jgi:[ribosomal protein S5]-alanine N-acetyltransferase